LTFIYQFLTFQVDNSGLYDSISSESGGTILIGAKLSSTGRDPEIKGVLARELTRYALYLTYENPSHPYNEHDITAAQKITDIINNLTPDDSNKCSSIISSIIRTSTPGKIQMDVIAAAIQILVQFDGNKEELTRFEVKFKKIFDFFENFILPQVKKLNLNLRKNIRKFNEIVDILPNLELELSELKDVQSLIENNLTIIQTNLPKLLILNIKKCLQIENEKNIFVNAEKFKNQELLKDFQDFLTQNQNLNIFVIFSHKIDENLKKIFTCKSTKFTLIVSDHIQCEELGQELTKLDLNPTKVEVNYSWTDLTVDSQKNLLKMKINFQNNSEFSFLDILKDEFNPEDEEVARNFLEVVDDQVLGLMLEMSEISINLESKELEIHNKFIKERGFIKAELIRDYEYL
jgi:hypothetical protein